MERAAFRSPLKDKNCCFQDEGFSARSSVRKPHKQAPDANIQSFAQLQEGLQSVRSSLSVLTETIGTALSESYSLSSRCSSSPAPASQPKAGTLAREQRTRTIASDSNLSLPTRELASAMASKAKLLLGELKTVKAELGLMRSRTSELEDENRRLRTTLEKGDEEDLVRLQLETLLAEKARLVQENATFKRENQLLHEVIDYHQLTAFPTSD